MIAAFEWHIFWDRIVHPDHVFAQALWRTVYIAVLAQVFGVALGLVSALMRMSRFRVLRILGGMYVLVIRGTPVIVQIFFIYFGANLFLGFDLFPYTEDQVAAVKRSVLQWRFIDSVAAKIDEPALREAQQAKDAVRAYELVYAALGA